MITKRLVGNALKGGFLFVSAALGETLGSTVAYGLKLKLFPEFRDAEIESAKRAIEEAEYLRKQREEEECEK